MSSLSFEEPAEESAGSKGADMLRQGEMSTEAGKTKIEQS